MPAASSKDCKSECSNGENTTRFSIPYIIFKYRKELRKPDTQLMKLFKTKFYLTDNLISNAISNISKYEVAEVMNINQQIMFKKRLYKKMKKIRQLEKLGIKNIDPNQLSDDM